MRRPLGCRGLLSVPETFIRTVPPRARGYGLIGLAAGVFVTALIVMAWSKMLPEVQRTNLKYYAKASAGSVIKLPKIGAAKRSGPTRDEYIRDALRVQVYGGESLLEMLEWPLIMGGGCTVVLFLLGKKKDSRFMRELRAGRVLSGPTIVTREEFNTRHA